MTSGTSLCMRSALELVTTAQPAAAKRGSISAAIEASRAAKMILGAPSGVAAETRIPATLAGIGVFNFHRAASPYGRPSERSEAATHATSNHGWCSSIWIKRCPTTPVAPRIPTGVFVGIRSLDFTTCLQREPVLRFNPRLGQMGWESAKYGENGGFGESGRALQRS